MALAKETLDLGQLVPFWVERLKPRAESLGETLVSTVEPVPPITGDAGRLEQVVTNLVDNALKYNRAGGAVTVTLACREATAPSASAITKRRRSPEISRTTQWVTIAVTDNGPGIPAQDLGRVFERFYRGDKARAAGGSGLGLSIAQEIARAHGGRIEVASEPGKGSTFTVFLPAA